MGDKGTPRLGVFNKDSSSSSIMMSSGWEAPNKSSSLTVVLVVVSESYCSIFLAIFARPASTGRLVLLVVISLIGV